MSSPRDLPLRILVHTDMVGAIIGRSGNTIRGLTQQTKARIDIHREESPDLLEKVITINGSPESCSEACFKIIEIILNERDSKNGTQLDGDTEITLKILAPYHLIGRLIGRRGSSIRKIMEETSTKINISVNRLTLSTGEHTITVVGKLEQIREAEKLITSKLRAVQLKDMNNSLQTMNQQTYLVNNLPYMPNSYGQSPMISSIIGQSGHSSNSRNLSFTPPQAHLPGAIYPSAPNGNYLPLYPNLNLAPAPPIPMSFNEFEFERETVDIYVPSTMVGAIIGKSGSVIKEMISTSGATIKVATSSKVEVKQIENCNSAVRNGIDGNPRSDDTQDIQLADPPVPNPTSPKSTGPKNGTIGDLSATRKVTITGNPAAQYSAQFMIYRKVSIETGKSDISLLVEIEVPCNLVGKIIGVGGSTVKQLQKTTRTTIRFPGDKSRSANSDTAHATNEITTVQIIGQFDGSQIAQKHIRNMVRKASIRRQDKLPSHGQTNRNGSNNESNTNNDAQSKSNVDNVHQSDNTEVDSVIDKSNKISQTSHEGSPIDSKNQRGTPKNESPLIHKHDGPNKNQDEANQWQKSHDVSSNDLGGTDRTVSEPTHNNNNDNMNCSKQHSSGPDSIDMTNQLIDERSYGDQERKDKNETTVHVHNNHHGPH